MLLNNYDQQLEDAQKRMERGIIGASLLAIEEAVDASIKLNKLGFDQPSGAFETLTMDSLCNTIGLEYDNEPVFVVQEGIMKTAATAMKKLWKRIIAFVSKVFGSGKEKEEKKKKKKSVNGMSFTAAEMVKHLSKNATASDFTEFKQKIVTRYTMGEKVNSDLKVYLSYMKIVKTIKNSKTGTFEVSIGGVRHSYIGWRKGGIDAMKGRLINAKFSQLIDLIDQKVTIRNKSDSDFKKATKIAKTLESSKEKLCSRLLMINVNAGMDALTSLQEVEEYVLTTGVKLIKERKLKIKVKNGKAKEKLMMAEINMHNLQVAHENIHELIANSGKSGPYMQLNNICRLADCSETETDLEYIEEAIVGKITASIKALWKRILAFFLGSEKEKKKKKKKMNKKDAIAKILLKHKVNKSKVKKAVKLIDKGDTKFMKSIVSNMKGPTHIYLNVNKGRTALEKITKAVIKGKLNETLTESGGGYSFSLTIPAKFSKANARWPMSVTTDKSKVELKLIDALTSKKGKGFIKMDFVNDKTDKFMKNVDKRMSKKDASVINNVSRLMGKFYKYDRSNTATHEAMLKGMVKAAKKL